MAYYTVRQAAERLSLSRGRIGQMVMLPPDSKHYLPSILDQTGRRMVEAEAVELMRDARILLHARQGI